MSGRILQVNFKFNVSGEAYTEAVSPMAEEISQVNGLHWKVWILNDEESEAGGILFFKDKVACNAYLNGPIVAQITSHPALSDFSVKQFDVMDEQTAITRGPIQEMAHS